MIGESQRRLRRYAGHVTVDAVGPVLGRFVRGGMAGGADAVVPMRIAIEGVVTPMAREAGEGALALAEAGAFAQVDGLVAHVPGVVPIDSGPRGRGRTVAPAAKFVEVRSGHSLWIADRMQLGRPRVLRSGSVADL